MEEFEFKVVGTDENGNPLYQKVAKNNDINSALEPEPIPQTTITSTPPVAIKKPSGSCAEPNLKSIANGPNNCLYQNMTSEEIKLKHNESVECFSDISFRDNEFVVKIIRRHPIGLMVAWMVAALVSILMVFLWFAISTSVHLSDSSIDSSSIMGYGILILVLIMSMSALFAYIFTRIYSANRMIVTTERVVQYISNGLFDTKKQSIDLGWIEDVSSHKTGIIATIFDFGSVRLSTIGDESTYYFSIARNPRKLASQLNEIVMAVKNEDALPNIND